LKIEGAIERLFLYLFQMKINWIILLIGFVLLQCQSSNDEKDEVEQKYRILNSKLRNIIPQLVELRNQTIDDRMHHSGELYVYILTSENFVYVHTSVMDCVNSSFYRFSEKMGEKNYSIWVDKRSVNPDRYFDLKDAQLIERKEGALICHYWYWLKSKFSLVNSDLKLTKVSSFYDDSYSDEDFYEKEDSAFYKKIEVLMVEPEPEPPIRQK
jgi:hypothetical protein